MSGPPKSLPPLARSTVAPCRALLVNPRFNGDSFWSYRSTCELVGASYPAPSLGLLTVAALLPDTWEVRLHDRNVDPDERLDELFGWAEILLVGGMLTQQNDHLALVARAQARGLPVVSGGPDPTSSPQLYEHADFLVIGEAEGVMDRLLADWEAGIRRGRYVAPRGSVDVTRSPTPRFDLLDFSRYGELTVQFSRGCPFMCEFCDIIELYGRKPRTKATPQVLAELDRLYELGYRGAIEFSDDNLIGNKPAAKAFLPHLIEWQKEHGYPFDFATEASLNLAEDPEMIALLREANFFAVFMGIESPDPDVLTQMQKKQNVRRPLIDAIRTIQAAGIFVVGGFIVGFDNERPGTGEAIVEFIEEAAIGLTMLSLLYALPNTQLTKRLEREGRLHADFGIDNGGTKLDQCVAGLNFSTLRPREEVLADYRVVLDKVYDKQRFFARVRRTVDALDCSGTNGSIHRATLGWALGRLGRFLLRVTFRHPEFRGEMWRTLFYILRTKPRALRAGVVLMGFYAHLGPFTRKVMREMDDQIARERALRSSRSAAGSTATTTLPPIAAAAVS